MSTGPRSGIFFTGRQARVLIVDDEIGVLRAAERVLESRYHVAVASSPAEALMLAPQFRPDLVICDIRMPGMDGFAVVERLREIRPGVDVIFMTGSHTDPDAQLVRSIKDRAFYFIQKPFDRQVLTTLVDRCLELRRLRDAEAMHLHRIEREIADARIVQGAMLAPPRASIDGFEIEARYKPCTELCGDFYDYAQAGPGQLAVIVADVCGHGVSAALLTASVKSAFQAFVGDRFRPLPVIDRLAETMQSFTEDRFATVLVALLDREARRLTYVNAGHPPALLWGRGTATVRLASNGPWVGPAFPLKSWEPAVVPLPPDARLLLYTDGVTDARGHQGSFGIARLLSSVQAHPTDRSGPGSLLARLSDEFTSFTSGRPQHDDSTMLHVALAT